MMFIRMKSHARSIFKAVSWRTIGAVDTFGLAFLVTGEWKAAAGVVGLEVITKTVLYYVHERGWEMVKFGHHS